MINSADCFTSLGFKLIKSLISKFLNSSRGLLLTNQPLGWRMFLYYYFLVRLFIYSFVFFFSFFSSSS